MQGLLNIFGDPETLKGLLTPDQVSRAQNDALMQASMSLLRSGGPSLVPVSTGQAIADAYDAGRGAFGKGVESQVNNALTAAKVADVQRQREVLKRRNELLANVEPSRLNEAYAASLQSGDIELAKLFADQIKANRQVLKPGERLYEGDKVVAEGAADPEKRRLTGAVGNLALTMFGSNDVGSLTPQQLQAVDAEARRRNLERPPSVSVNVGGEKAFESEVGKADAKFFSDVSATGLQAQRGLAQVNQLDALLRSTGGGLPVVAKQYAAQFGVKLGKDAGDIEAATAIINQLVPQQRPAGAGTMSDKDVELFKSSVPNLMNTPEGNAKILATMRAMAQYDAQIGDIAQRAMAGEINRTQARAMMNQLQNPLSGFGLPAGVTVERVK